MGQGVYTSMAMLLAEELEVDLNRVRLEHAPPDDALYGNSILHIQTTGLSTSIRAFWTPLRQAGAVARTLLISAAAHQWAVDPGALTQLELLTTEESLITIDASVAASDAALIQDQIALFKALGGDWRQKR
jgi:isoquinoline 1-oxidoreductase beta subunit